MMEKKTPLYESHVALGAKMVEFGGFLMPVQYPSGILAEHMAVREKAGLFDVSHMGELVFHGEDALANIQRLVTTDISKMLDGDMRYGMFCNDEGGVVDDLIVYRMAQDGLPDRRQRRQPRQGRGVGGNAPVRSPWLS